MIKTNKIAFILLSSALFLASCTKEGPAGPEGLQGEQGAQGEKGPKGDNGTANVIYSDWMKLSFQQLSDGTYQATIKAPELTQDIQDNGEVAVYMDINSNIYKLPFYLVSSSGTISRYVRYYFGDFGVIGPSIALRASFSGVNDYRFRYVLIPGGVPVSTMPSSPVPDLKNYHAVCQYYGMPD